MKFVHVIPEVRQYGIQTNRHAHGSIHCTPTWAK